jgi:hypothetical protein
MMRASLASFLVTGLVLGVSGGPALGEEPSTELVVAPHEDATRFLPTTSSAVVGSAADVTTAWGGYDGAARTPTFSVTTELRVVRRVSLVGGVAYGNGGAADAGLRPQVGARVQLFREAASGMDASVAFLFRQDRFTSEDGLFQGSVALGRSFGETAAVLNVIYAQDGEGDDHEGEVRLAGIRRVRGGLHVGLEGRYMHSIDSTDPRRAMKETPSVEAMVAPMVAYTVGSWAFVAEAGVSSRKTTGIDTGLLTLGGIGTTF